MKKGLLLLAFIIIMILVLFLVNGAFAAIIRTTQIGVSNFQLQEILPVRIV